MAIGQARLNNLGLSALARRERSMGERRRVERNKLFFILFIKIAWFGDILK
jgi:hypothetical protein